MPQRLSPRSETRGGDRAHLAVGISPIALIVPVLALLILLLAPGVLRAQSRGTVQVAAQVLLAEPSRTALELATVSLAAVRPALRYSRLARIRVEFAAPDRPVGGPARRVRIDFLRN
jgi:hypothetical protein